MKPNDDLPRHASALLEFDAWVDRIALFVRHQGQMVDGQVGPRTRDALGAFQADHDLEVTSAIDEPTVEALDLAETTWRPFTVGQSRPRLLTTEPIALAKTPIRA